MQFVSLSRTTTLKQLNNSVGRTNVQSILSANDLTWSPDIGRDFDNKCRSIINTVPAVPYQRKATLLNKFIQDDDVFEKAALASEDEWKLISNLGTFAEMLKIPETVQLPDSAEVLGSGNAVDRSTYARAMAQLQTEPHSVDPEVFNSYSSIRHANIFTYASPDAANPFQFFRLPTGKITLYSSIFDASVEFPVYPEEMSDSRKANYSTMPDLLYQPEPWQIYESSGPRSNTYEFFMHRDMFTGDHRDGLANDLIRFCEANCYPEFTGSTVNTAIVTLYVAGKVLIRGILTDVSVEWSGPILSDDWYAAFKLTLSITEVAGTELTVARIRNKPIIG